jgi:hypothetical protein
MPLQFLILVFAHKAFSDKSILAIHRQAVNI